MLNRLTSTLLTGAMVATQLHALAHGEVPSREDPQVEKRGGPQWYLFADYSGPNFFQLWNYKVGVDFQNWGSVLWQSQQDAAVKHLTYINSAGNAILKVDNTTQGITTDAYNSSYVGRASLYMTTQRSYDEGSLVLAQFRHAPSGCGLWPGFWSMGGTPANWPTYGEIDIFENVNLKPNNAYSLHTTDGCRHPFPNQTADGVETGSIDPLYTDCFNGTAHNSGCLVGENKPANYGPTFNQNGGGAYAFQWTYDAMQMWFFPRQSIPSDYSSSNPDPSGWGAPSAYFPRTSCDFSKYFGPQHVVIDIDICGLYAGDPNIFVQDGNCTGKCTDLMQHPENFNEAYFEIEFLRLFANSTQNAKAWAQTTLPPDYDATPTNPGGSGSFLPGGGGSSGSGSSSGAKRQASSSLPMGFYTVLVGVLSLAAIHSAMVLS